MIDVMLSVDATGAVHGPFESWQALAVTIEDLRRAGAGDMTIVRENLVCDFCSAPQPRWTYKAGDATLAVIGSEVHMSRGDWLACELCHAYIKHEDWLGLHKHAADGWKDRYAALGVPFSMAESFVAQAHQVFRAAKTGDPPTQVPTDKELLG